MLIAPVRVKSLLTTIRLKIGCSIYRKEPMSPSDLAKLYENISEICDLLDVEPLEINEIGKMLTKEK